MQSLKQYKTGAIILSACMMILGIVMIIWPNVSALVVCYLMGAICIATGVYELIRYFDLGVVGILFRYDLLVSILSILVGIILLFHPLGALTILPIILGLYIIIAGVFSIQISTESRHFGMNDWWMSLVFGIVGIIFGLLMVINPFAGASTLMEFIGIALLLTGIENLYIFRCISKTFKSDEHQKIIDAVWHEVK